MNTKRTALVTAILLTSLTAGCASLPDTLAQINRSLDALNTRLDQAHQERLQETAPRWGIVEDVFVQQVIYNGQRLTQQELRVRIKGRPDTIIYVTPPQGPIYRPGTIYYF